MCGVWCVVRGVCVCGVCVCGVCGVVCVCVCVWRKGRRGRVVGTSVV
jgi:hypothetical protein